jgi:lysophospholipase L1-like esterase
VRELGSPLAEGLNALARMQRERGVKVVVALLPAFSEPFEHYKHAALHARMRATAARLPTLAWIDLLADFRAAGVDPRTLSVDGLHPNRAGTAVLAEILQRRLAERALP